VQESPGHDFTVVQIGLNMVAILGGIVGEGALAAHFAALLGWVLQPGQARSAGFALSFLTITGLFIVLADLVPRRLGMNDPERLAMRTVGPMIALTTLLKPLVWVFNGLSDALSRLLGLPEPPRAVVRRAAYTPAACQASTTPHAPPPPAQPVCASNCTTTPMLITCSTRRRSRTPSTTACSRSCRRWRPPIRRC
jgi:hypothetical protein